MGVLKLAAIFVVWADCEDILQYAVDNIAPVVDGIIVVWSKKSNHGVEINFNIPRGELLPCAYYDIQCEPTVQAPQLNELSKRNAGLDAVKKLGYTHFIMMDADEFYLQDEFTAAKEQINREEILGSVCRIKTYFKSPTLTIGYDHTLVPFIHRIRRHLAYKLNFHGYPFAYQRGTPYIDPTRRLNVTGGIKMMDITMHHMSYVRKDMALKLENSSANFRKGRADGVYEDLKNAEPGYFCKGYQKTLMECENIFNLPIYE